MEGSRKRNTGAETTTPVVAWVKQEWKLTADGQEGIWGVKGTNLELDAGDGCSII